MGSKAKAPKIGESQLSKESLGITRSHEALFQELAVPILREINIQTAGDGLTVPLAQAGAADIGRSFDQSQRSLLQSFARRGLSGSGVAGSGLARLESARARSLAENVSQSRLKNLGLRSQLFGQIASVSPKPVTTGVATTQR